jgi:hypothetical protein
MNRIFIVVVLIAGYMDCRCLSTAAFAKEIDGLTGVTCSPYHGKVLCCN